MAVLHETKPIKTSYVTITREEYESMKATIDVLSDTGLMKQIIESKNAVNEGRVKNWDDLKKEIIGKR